MIGGAGFGDMGWVGMWLSSRSCSVHVDGNTHICTHIYIYTYIYKYIYIYVYICIYINKKQTLDLIDGGRVGDMEGDEVELSFS